MYWQNLILILYTISLSLILLFSIGQLYLLLSYLKQKIKKKPSQNSLENYPEITIQLPIYNEKYVLERLIKAVCAINYPKEKLEIQVLDDSDDESVEEIEKLILAKKNKGINIYRLCRENKLGFKAGALQNGLVNSKGEFIVIFDADFVPDRNFLKQLLPYFKHDVGLVQSSWAYLNRNYSLLTKVQAFALDGHFSIEQTGRNNANLFMNFNGTAGIWRKKCIEDAGGWHYDTLTEDLDLSYRAQLKGWKFKYVENVHTLSELPVELNAFQSQQHRWTKGAIETSKKLYHQVLESPNSFKRKVFGILHLGNAYSFLIIFLAGILSVPVLFIKNDPIFNSVILLNLSMFFGGYISVTLFYIFSYFSRNKSIIEFILLYPVFLCVSMAMSFYNSLAVLEGVFGFKSNFIRTPKFNISKKINKQHQTNKYIKKQLSPYFYFEFLLFVYYAVAIIYGFRFKDYSFIVFHFMLSFGYLVLNFYAIKHRFTKSF